MTTNGSNNYQRSYSSRTPRTSVRSSNYAPFGSASTRPPTNAGYAGAYPPKTSLEPTNLPQLGPTIVVDESNWFGSHDQASAEETAARSMAALVGRIIGAKPFPMSARRLADLTRRDVVRIEPVIQVLETDPGLSARLLRLVNSAGYALRQRCTSVRHAATLVGTDRLHQIATTAAVLDLFDSKGPAAAQIIEHSTEVGAFCRYLGAHLALPVDDLFTAGFLHDIGKLMFMETEGEQYVELLLHCGSQPDTLHLLERQLFGFDHAALAAHVLAAWNIPDPVPKIVGWHHDPTHAYKISSVMAALVQTIRLSDAIVYAMQTDVDRTCIKTLAQHEAACYLDISEPQLAAMWDELRILFDESQRQCLGENAPALDPRSLKPRLPKSLVVESAPEEKAHDLPKQFPCVACGSPTFGNTCPACGGYVCPEHQVGSDEWCTLCANDFKTEKKSIPVPIHAKWAFGALGAAVVLSGLLGMFTSGGLGAVRAGVGTLLLAALLTLLYLVGKIWFVRTRFIRTRPNRSIAEAQVNNGGTQSLVPTQGPEGADSPPAAKLAGFPATGVHFVEPSKEITIREISTSPSMPDSEMRSSPGLDVPSNALSGQSPEGIGTSNLDPLRLQLQSQSLVTLPAPKHAGPEIDAIVNQDLHESPGTPRRSPRDTLREQDLVSGQSSGSPASVGCAEYESHASASVQHPDAPRCRETDPEPESTSQDPYRGASRAADESTATSATARTQLDLSRVNSAQPPDDDAKWTGYQRANLQESDDSELISIAQPIVAVLAEPEESSVTQEFPTSDLGQSSSADDTAGAGWSDLGDTAAADPGDVLADFARTTAVMPTWTNEAAAANRATTTGRDAPSLHPLAVLGIHSQPPSAAGANGPTETQAPVCNDAEPERSTVAAINTEASPAATESATPPGPIISVEAANDASEVAGNVQNEVASAIVPELVAEQVARLGADFDARVRELVAQRVAEIVTARVLSALDVDAIGAQVKDRLGATSHVQSNPKSRPAADGIAKKRSRSPRKV